ncbi:MAG: hypothetical protein EZS28_010076 [Streblomastix strix]|uniref:Uncharacterized protein n=1 Tax=Streblomastix strix TaxID=222440 RepID=A0A5J4WJ63_9EUKA|nr:MAG: hypothetical protein EZS28_010076 [Streblomastix strix]
MDQEKNEQIDDSSDIFTIFGENCAICGNIPSISEQADLHEFLQQFGELRNVLLEQQNGEEARQALAFFTTQEGQKLILTLKNGIIESKEKDEKDLEQQLDVLCGLATISSNISDIAQNSFINVIAKIAKTFLGRTKAFALELLLLFVENGGIKIRKAVKSIIGENGLLDLIGESDKDLNERALKQTMKWNNNNLLKKMMEFIERKDSHDQVMENEKKDRQNLDEEEDDDEEEYNSEFDEDEDDDEEEEAEENEYGEDDDDIDDEEYDGDEIENENKWKLKDQQVVNCFKLLNEQIEQLKKYKQNGQEIPSLTIGMISCICIFLLRTARSYVSFIEDSNKNLIRETELVEQMFKLLEYLPIKHINRNHLNPLTNLIAYYQCPFNTKPYVLSVLQKLIQYINHPSIKVVDLVVFTLHSFFTPNSDNDFYHSSYDEDISQIASHPFYYALKQDGSIDLMGKCIISQQDKDIQAFLSQAYCSLCRNHAVPSDVLQTIIQTEQRVIELLIFQKDSIDDHILSFLYLSLCQENHSILLSDDMHQDLHSYDMRIPQYDYHCIVQLLQVMYERGNANTRLQIKQQFPVEWIQKHIMRDKMNYKYYSKYQNGEYNERFTNLVSFILIGQYQEEQIMEDVAFIMSGIVDECEKYATENKNIFDKVKKAIKIACKASDKDIIYGAMGSVQEGFSYYLYEVAMRWNEEELYDTLELFIQLVDELDDEVLANFVDTEMISWLFYIQGLQEGERQRDQTLKIIEKATFLGAVIMERET